MPASSHEGAAPELLLPERSRLLHIGLPKTGTTALQRTAVARHGALKRAGVLYPRGLTNRHDHLMPVASLMGMRLAETDGVPGPEHWSDLRRRVDSETERRVWISHEWIAESDDDQARRFRDELGEDLHVVVSVRQFGSILTATWQEFLKTTMLHTFDDWLAYTLTDRPAPDPHTRWQVKHVAMRAEQGAIVERWARVVGADNVTVVVVDPAHRDNLTGAFEGMLGLPAGMLDVADDGGVANRGMTVGEASLMLALNEAYEAPETSFEKRKGRLPIALPQAILERRPRGDEAVLALPGWAADLADAASRRHADEIAATGVRVVGDLDALRIASRATDAPHHNDATDVPVDVAVAVARGIVRDHRAEQAAAAAVATTALATAQREQARLAAERDRLRHELRLREGPLVGELRAADLVREAARRVARRLRGG
ncbi:hypothetical protein [Microbacterium indicum]|uniref:hypothetical protein n=1 Tax=Microbacterium indicum TaxID=358100 RepID=UPI0003F85AA8|nr:hypothetical protein [Microbacterium indicum]